MSDQTDTPQPPSFATTLTHSLAQKVAAMAAAALLSGHLIPATQVPADTQVIAGAVLLVGSVIWTWVRTRIDVQRSHALAAAAAK